MKMLPVSPIWYGREKSIMDIFVPIQFHRVAIEKTGSRRDTKQKVETYKDMFYTNNTLNDRVSIQGDPGMGKTTFLAKLVIDWCDSDSKAPKPSSKFSDVETLQNFRFLFHIKLRDSFGQSKVVDMIKTQIIDELYFNEKQQREAFDLLGSVMERETCLVTMDGLNEWTDHTNGNPLPKMYTLSKQCVVLTTSRPWKMADKRIRDSEIGTLIEAVGITDTEQLTKNIMRSLTEDDQESYKECMAYVEERNLNHFLASPWMLTLLINLWMDKTFLSGSLCEINKVLIITLFDKELPNEGLTESISSENAMFGHHTEICNALASVAFNFTFSTAKSLVLSKHELLSTEMLSNEQLEFAIRSGVLNERHCFSAASSKSQVSFLHETIQEFFAASHIANLPEDTITNIFCKSNYNVLEISQVIIYLSGLKCDVANKVMQYLTEDVFNEVNTGLGRLITGSYDPNTTLTFQKTVINPKPKLNSKIGINPSSELRCLEVALSMQKIMISCYHEAKVSRQKHIRLEMSDFTFHAYLNKKEIDDLLQILKINTSLVRTLLLERNVLHEHIIITVLQQSKHCIERLKTPGSRGIISALHTLNLKQLTLIGKNDMSLFSWMLPSLGNLTFLRIEESDFCEDIFPPSNMQYICLLKSRCSAEFVGRLLVHLSQISHPVRCNLGEIYTTEKTDFHIAKILPRIALCDMSKLHLCLGQGAAELYELLNATNLGKIQFETADGFLLASERLHTINILDEISLSGTYIGTLNVRLPTMLQRVALLHCKISLEWLCSLLNTLSSLDHHVECELWDVVLQSSDETCEDESHTRVSELRSKILSYNMSNIEILVDKVSKELIEILRDTCIGILNLQTADSASLASEILHTLNKLTKLYLWETYTDRCDLKMPASLQCISLHEFECSSEWLCSLWIKLCSLDHQVECELWDVVLKSNEEARGNESHSYLLDLRSELLAHDMSNIKILVKTGSKELFEILRDTSIGILDLRTADCASLASEILHTLNKLTKLYLWETYTGRCDLKVPASLQCISLQSVECSSEWLCRLWMSLSSLDHQFMCELWDVVLKSNKEASGNESHSYLLDLRSELLAHDMSNIEILVKTGSKELFEILRDTSIGILNLPTAESASLASEILHTLNKLTKLYLRGTYTGRCDLKMPASLQCISLQSVECSSEWLCSLWITLSSLDHQFECELWDVVLKSNEEASGNESHSYLLDLRSELLAHDMSNIEILVKTGSKELFEILRDTSIGILNLPTAESASLASEILHTLNKLTKLYLRGTYTGRCDLKMPASLQCISLQSVECSSEWLCSLWMSLSSLDHQIECELWDVVLKSNEEASGNESHSYLLDMRSELMAHDMSNIEILVKTGSKELFEILRDTSIGILNLPTAESASLASEILHTLNKLTKLYLWGTYTGRCDLKMPASLQCISLQSVECSSEWLCSLWITLSSLDHQVECVLWDVVLKSNEEASGNESHSYLLDLRSELLAHDMSNIEILVKTGSKELFEILRDTSIGILNLPTAESASLASEILHTLNKLTKLYLRGAYTGRCDLKMPASLQCISLQSVECSSEWLCSLWITLSSLDHQFKCELWDVVLKSNEEASGNESHSYLLDLRSELLAHDMSNIEILVKTGSKELFEILRDTSIGILNLPTAESASLASEILHTLNKLTKLYLRGAYTGRCDLKMPASLQCISLQSVECSSEWLCSLWMSLSSLDHQIECELWDVVLKSNEEASGNESHSYLLDLRSELLAHDMSNIEILVKTGSKELFEILRDTSIGILNLPTAESASLASEILHTLNKLTKLYLWGTYTGRCDLKMPASLQCISLQSVECSSEWLCSFLITLSEVHHQVECTMFNFLVKTSDTESGIETDSTVIRSELLSCDLSHVKLNVEHNSRVPFELVRSTNINSLLLTANDDASLDVVTQSSLTMLKEIRFNGIHMTRFDHKLPSTLQFMILCDGYCSPDWLKRLMIHLSTLGHTVRLYLYKYAVVSSGESNAMALEPPILKCEDLSNVKLELMKDSYGLYETLPTINITSLNMTQIERPDILSQTLPLLTHLQQLRMCLKQYTVMKLPGSIKYVFIIYTTFSPSSLQHFVQDMYTAQHNVQCKLLFRVEGNEDDYTRIKHEVCKLESVEMQKFEVVDKRHFRGAVAAAATLSATADEADDDFDKHLLRREGYVDSRTWLHYCKIRLKFEFR
ncbi:hypothetical protein DPMN_164365 [Dreissena polymorpha]|uniref:NACHT domain-containing protein n=1 Tax=Dreissena polymorpha TaxID=45954 RepID=A0A9D4IVC7_DREPO|nr:hypothetical protein DPMN_164365 [Dreissena polymorpha]